MLHCLKKCSDLVHLFMYLLEAPYCFVDRNSCFFLMDGLFSIVVNTKNRPYVVVSMFVVVHVQFCGCLCEKLKPNGGM